MGFNSHETRLVWERLAAFWDDQIGEGNEFQRVLIMPATDRLLKPQPAQEILDVACGNGNYSRRLGRAGARVVASDFCEAFLQLARRRTVAGDGQIEYVSLDATDPAALHALGRGRFDSVVCSMALMDMPTIDPLLLALPRLLKPGGRFVFSLPHPCFNTNHMKLTAELVQEHEINRQAFGVEVRQYLTQEPALTAGIINQPEPHPYFHRPLSAVLGSCFAAGLLVDGLEEPAFAADSPGRSAFAWARRPEIPPVIVIRAVPGTAPDQT